MAAISEGRGALYSGDLKEGGAFSSGNIQIEGDDQTQEISLTSLAAPQGLPQGAVFFSNTSRQIVQILAPGSQCLYLFPGAECTIPFDKEKSDAAICIHSLGSGLLSGRPSSWHPIGKYEFAFRKDLWLSQSSTDIVFQGGYYRIPVAASLPSEEVAFLKTVKLMQEVWESSSETSLSDCVETLANRGLKEGRVTLRDVNENLAHFLGREMIPFKTFPFQQDFSFKSIEILEEEREIFFQCTSPSDPRSVYVTEFHNRREHVGADIQAGNKVLHLSPGTRGSIGTEIDRESGKRGQQIHKVFFRDVSKELSLPDTDRVHDYAFRYGQENWTLSMEREGGKIKHLYLVGSGYGRPLSGLGSEAETQKVVLNILHLMQNIQEDLNCQKNSLAEPLQRLVNQHQDKIETPILDVEAMFIQFLRSSSS